MYPNGNHSRIRILFLYSLGIHHPLNMNLTSLYKAKLVFYRAWMIGEYVPGKKWLSKKDGSGSKGEVIIAQVFNGGLA
jgi:hypothetical protein